jgi:hypothetical protein
VMLLIRLGASRPTEMSDLTVFSPAPLKSEA